METTIALLSLGALVVAAIPLYWATTYNRLVKLRESVRESWSDIDVQLKRRYELIPNLVETVKGYAAHEREVLDSIIELRNQAMANVGAVDSQAADENALLHELKRLFVLVEGYPQLKADAQFRALQEELADTEDRIAASRRFYNANVRELNQLTELFPSKFVARHAGIGRVEYFELESAVERVVPQVSLAE